MGPGDMGPLEYAPIDDFDPRLLAAREELPEWDIYRASFGYLAVPAGTPVYAAASADALTEKVRSCES